MVTAPTQITYNSLIDIIESPEAHRVYDYALVSEKNNLLPGKWRIPLWAESFRGEGLAPGKATKLAKVFWILQEGHKRVTGELFGAWTLPGLVELYDIVRPRLQKIYQVAEWAKGFKELTWGRAWTRYRADETTHKVTRLATRLTRDHNVIQWTKEERAGLRILANQLEDTPLEGYDKARRWTDAISVLSSEALRHFGMVNTGNWETAGLPWLPDLAKGASDTQLLDYLQTTLKWAHLAKSQGTEGASSLIRIIQYHIRKYWQSIGKPPKLVFD